MRLEITRRADIAVRALVLLHRANGARLKGAEMAATLGTTAGFIPQALAPMVQAGWIRSESGPQGGYDAVANLGEINVLAVIEAVEGPTDTGVCMVSGSECGWDAPCALHAAWSRSRQILVESLAATRLADLEPDA